MCLWLYKELYEINRISTPAGEGSGGGEVGGPSPHPLQSLPVGCGVQYMH